MNQPAVEFDDVTCSFVSDDNKHYTAVRDVNLTIGDASSLADLYSKADKALYQVKQQGRNGTVLE